MNFLKFKNANDFLERTSLSIEEGLTVVEGTLERLRKS